MTKEVYFKQMARGGFVRGKSFWNKYVRKYSH